MLNQQFGNYKFLSVLGEGGMAIVYLAENTMLGSLVAIKVLKEDFVSNKNVRSRFLDEAKKMVRVKHPNIIQVMDLIDAGDIVAIVMEYIEGQSLKDLIESNGKMSQSEIEHLFPQILLALQHVHKAGFVHRDIKPSNFMLSTDGTIKLADFGIAKDKNVAAFTETGTQMGTPMYMSPEQIKSTRDVDHRSDIYSLGVVLYEMVTGTFPFDKNNLSLPEIQVCILRNPLPKSGSLWDTQIAKATAKNEIDRFQSCIDWMESFAKKEQANAFDKPVDKASQPNTSSTNYSSSSSESTYETSQKKILFFGVGVIVFICFLAFLMWPKYDSGDSANATSTTQSISEENELSEIDKSIYINLTKDECSKLCDSLNLSPEEKAMLLNSYGENGKYIGRGSEKSDPVKPQTGKTAVTVVINYGDAYSKLQQAADSKCGKGKISTDDWTPYIRDASKIKLGIYTCDCPK